MIIFTLLGLVFLVLGLGMAVATLLPGVFGLSTAEGELLGLGITALTFIPVGLVFSAIGLVSAANARRDARLGRVGLRGRATIEAVSNTNVTVNDNPMVKLELAVQVSGRSPYRLSKRATVPRLAAGLLAPGATVPVRVDPEDPDEMRIEWNDLVPAGGPVAQEPGSWADASGATAPDAAGPAVGARSPGLVPEGLLDPALRQRVNAVLADLQSTQGLAIPASGSRPPFPTQPSLTVDLRGLRQGPASAQEALEGRTTVQAYTDTGVDADGGRLYTFDLEIRLADRAAYSVKHAAVLDRDAAARLFRGASFPVRVDVADEQRLVIDWGT